MTASVIEHCLRSAVRSLGDTTVRWSEPWRRKASSRSARWVSAQAVKIPQTCFLAEIRHYVYAGDTALHVAAASHQIVIAELLVGRGANVCARNRRGAEPLHSCRRPES
jgi:hypothetical protein